jgi:hypothetical protein
MAERTYLELVRLFPKDFRLIECFERGKLLNVEEVHERIWQMVAASLKL